MCLFLLNVWNVVFLSDVYFFSFSNTLLTKYKKRETNLAIFLIIWLSRQRQAAPAPGSDGGTFPTCLERWQQSPTFSTQKTLRKRSERDLSAIWTHSNASKWKFFESQNRGNSVGNGVVNGVVNIDNGIVNVVNAVVNVDNAIVNAIVNGVGNFFFFLPSALESTICWQQKLKRIDIFDFTRGKKRKPKKKDKKD